MSNLVRCCALGLVSAAVLVPASALGQSGPLGSFAQVGQRIQAGQVRAAAPAATQPGSVKPLSVEEAVRLALEQNLTLQVQRLDPQLQDLTTEEVKTAWTPTVSSTVLSQSSTNPVSSFLSGATDKLINDRFDFSVQADQNLPWGGGSYDVQWNNIRGKSNSVFDSPNPALSSNIVGTFTQPLLRNFKIDSTRQQLLISKKNREMTDVQLKQTVLVTVRAVKSAYWDLAFAIGNLKVQQQSLDIARESLRNNKTRVSIGTMAPIDIIEAEAEVARNEESVIVAEAEITRSEDALRQLIFDPKVSDVWNTHLELTDSPVFEAQDVNVDAAVKTALERRTDIANVRKSLEASDINIRYFKNQTLPDLSVQAGYGLTGQGGTLYQFSDTFPPVPTSVVTIPYSEVLSHMVSNDFHNWSVAVTVGYPLGKSSGGGGARQGEGVVQPDRVAAPQPRTVGDAAGARNRADVEHQPQAGGSDPGVTGARRAAAGGGTEEVPGRHVHEFPGHPGPARPGVGQKRGTPGGPRLQPVDRGFRDRAGGAAERRRHRPGDGFRARGRHQVGPAVVPRRGGPGLDGGDILPVCRS